MHNNLRVGPIRCSRMEKHPHELLHIAALQKSPVVFGLVMEVQCIEPPTSVSAADFAFLCSFGGGWEVPFQGTRIICIVWMHLLCGKYLQVQLRC